MADTPEPTGQDHRNAAVRRAIADKQARDYQEAQGIAEAALGRGWRPWMKLLLLDSDYHRTGDATPHATAIKVYRGEARLSERSLFLRKLPDGLIQVSENYADLFPELHAPHPTRTLEIGGKLVPAPHWTLTWSAVEDGYSPKTAEELAAARLIRERKREKRADQAFIAGNPLLVAGGIKRQDLEAGQGR